MHAPPVRWSFRASSLGVCALASALRWHCVTAQNSGNPNLDADTTLVVQVGVDRLNCGAAVGAPPCGPTSGALLIAGNDVNQLSMVVTNANYFPADLPSPSFMIVNTSVDKAALLADPTMCHPDSPSVVGSAVLYSASGTWAGTKLLPPFGAATQMSTASDTADPGWLQMSLVASEVPLQFHMGGQFRLCYSMDGSFGTNAVADVLEQTMLVWGIYDKRDACKSDDSCMRKRRQRCYVNREAYNNFENTFAAGSNCVLDYTYEGAGFEGDRSATEWPKVSWSEEFEASYTEAGAKVETTAKACGTQPSNFLCHSGVLADCNGEYFEPEFDGLGGLKLHFPPAINWMANLTVPKYNARTVAACYCAYDTCTLDTHFKQQVGLLMFYATKVCYNGLPGEIGCTDDFTGAAPQHRFSLRLLCPPDGCAGDTQNRIKIVPRAAVNDQPSWVTSQGSSVTGCATAKHGLNAQGKIVLPADDNPQVDVITGRGRQDYKIWNWKKYAASGLLDVSEGLNSGFMFDMGVSDHEKRSGGGAAAVGGESFDICYCDGECTEDGNWFKVGQLRYTPFQLLSALHSTATEQGDYVVEYANQPGMLGFYRTVEDRGVMGFSDGAMVKLVSDPGTNITDAGCKDDPDFIFDPKYDRDLVWPGPMIDYYYKTAYNEYQGATNETVDPNRFVFNNASASNRITVKKAGFLAVCYCSSHANGDCFSNNWVLATRLTIRGPKEGHAWHVSTHVTFSLEYEGWGLSSGDMLRIIPATSSCEVGGNDIYGPRGAYTVTNIKLRCPYPCAEVGEPTSTLHGGIETKVLADDAWMCNSQHGECRNNDIKSVTVLDEHTTELEFEREHGMKTGDLITLLDNIACHPDDAADECNEARLEVLMGAYKFADTMLAEKPAAAPERYYSGHRITEHPTDTKRVLIPVGWPTAPARPRFVVLYRNNKRGRWLRHSKAVTKLEILGERALENLRVCWAYTAPSAYPKYTTQVGTITFEDANRMQNCRITLTSLVKGQQSPWAPFIFSFTTAGSETGKAYSRVQGPTRLRLLFTSSTSAIYATFGDGVAIDVNTGEDELHEAKQYICGKLFRELWGSDPDIGFPMPRGCYYTVYGTTQEVNLVFDAKNGLKAGKDYQMVMTGVAMDEAVANEEYAQIYAMDDIEAKPFSSIERGLVLLSKGPMSPAYGTDGVELLTPDGVKVVSKTEPDMMELRGGNDITFAFKGEPSGGGIKAGSVLRIFLWPLTQWDVEGSCTATCTPHDAVTHPCGAVQDCRGDSLIANGVKNYLRIVFPASMSTMDDEVSHQLTLMGLRFPMGGFFPTKLGVELRRPDDTKPHYLETVGNYFYKEPEDGASVGKLVEYWGDGDKKPFKGEKGNVYYASLMLASTLFSALQSNDAALELVLPEGYECTYPQTAAGVSPWQAPSDLGVFGTTVPQGTGHPFEASAWSGVGNICRYSLRQNGVVFAGSSLMIRVTVNNPPFPLKRTDGGNRWKVQLKSKGFYSYQIAFPPVVFGSDAEMGNYSSNKPVLGKLTEARVVPRFFAASASSTSLQMTWVRIFFRTEQDSGVNSQIRIVPPVGFSFPNPCTVRDIPLEPFNYYAEYAPGLKKPTKRLPGIVRCMHAKWPGQSANSHIAGVMTGQFLADTYYGFETMVQNAFDYDRLGAYSWQLFTTDGAGNRVDGTPLAGVVAEEPTYGLYRVNLEDVTFFWSRTLLPSSIAGPARLEIGIKVPAALNGIVSSLRVLAPAGFVWDPTVDYLQENIGTPASHQDHMLLWAAQTYLSSKTYKFQCTIHIPDSSPTHTVNEFVIELGHDGNTLAQRHAAGRFIVSPVRALVAARLDWYQITNLRDPANELSFQFQTITDIPAGGGILISGPAGFIIANQDKRCHPFVPDPQRGSPYEVPSEKCCPTTVCPQRCPAILTLPGDLSCHVMSLDFDPVVVNLTAGAMGLKAGRYRFGLQAVNPGTPTPNPVNASSSCGRDLCWRFHARTDMSSTAPEDVSDSPTSTPAFPVTVKLVEAGIADITEQQAALTQRDDRPLFKNSLVFYFKLTKQMITKEVLLVRAPQGYVFDEDCISSLEIREKEVYGEGQDLAPGDTAWPTDVAILSCRGEGPNAYIRTDPGAGAGFLGERRYPFRISVYNPRTAPPAADNMWVIAYGDESSRPFTGFSLWTFKRTLSPPAPVSLGASPADSSAAKLWNPVTFTFAPHNTISGSGMSIVVTAPPTFQIANTLLVSRALIQPVSEVPGAGVGEVPPEPRYDSRPSSIWGDAELYCEVDAATRRTVTIKVLADVRELTAGRDYQLTIFVYNPMTTISADDVANRWVLQTYNSPGASPILPLFRDYITLPGFTIQDTVRTFALKNEEPATGIKFYNGLQRVKQLYVELQFPSKLQTLKARTASDLVTLETPAGYLFVDCAATFAWEPPKDYELYLPNSPRTCVNGNGPLEMSTMTIKIEEAVDLPAMRVIKFRIDVQNPAKTPHAMLNHWTVTHVNGGTGKVMATTSLLSWSIIPQLANPFLQLIGDTVNKAAGTTSRMAVSFVPINDADQLEVWARLPQGFDFTGCTTLTNGHEIITTNLDKVRVRASVFAGVTANIVIDGFKLGQIGGPTMFDLVTKLNNGEKMDEALSFRGGFVMPGNLWVMSKDIQSKYTLNPSMYPGERNVRMMSTAIVTFRIAFTRQAEAGDLIAISSEHYTLRPEDFVVRRLPARSIISTEVVSYVDGALVAQLRGTAMQATAPGLESPSYEVQVTVVSPNMPNADDARFRIEVRNPGQVSGAQLPLNTNDARDAGFRLVENIQVKMKKPPTDQVPPMAEVDVELFIDPRSTAPDVLYLMAPIMFNFTENCLVKGGTSNEILTCRYYDTDVSGRAIAELRAKAGGLTAMTDYVVITIITPGENSLDPKDRVWFLDARDSATKLQVGWGEDLAGVSVRQMDGAAVVFSGIPQVSGQLAVQFYTPEKVEAGGRIRVVYPRSIVILCDGAFFSPVAIEGAVTCYNNGREGTFDLEMARPMPPGLQAFTVTATPPNVIDDPGGNIFKILVYTPEGKVMDAAMKVPGNRIQHGITVSALPLVWGSSEGGRSSTVSLGFELLAELPERDPPVVSEVVVTVPATLEQTVTRVSHIEIMNDPLPLRSGTWLDVSNPRRLTLLFDERAAAVMKPARFRFSFPVMLPTKIPKYNVWHVTLCSPRLPGVNASCSGDPQDPRALTTFPLAGFNLGEVNPSASQYMAAASFGPRRSAPAGGWTLLWPALLLLLSFSSLWP